MKKSGERVSRPSVSQAPSVTLGYMNLPCKGKSYRLNSQNSRISISVRRNITVFQCFKIDRFSPLPANSNSRLNLL